MDRNCRSRPHHLQLCGKKHSPLKKQISCFFIHRLSPTFLLSYQSPVNFLWTLRPVIKQIIGQTVKTQRIKQGLCQEDLANECDVDQSYISMIEVGRNEPSVMNFFNLCRGLKISRQTLSNWLIRKGKVENTNKSGNKAFESLYSALITFVCPHCFLLFNLLLHNKFLPNSTTLAKKN